MTGGAGFLGSALVRRLVRDGHRVRVLDNGFRGGLRRLEDLAANVEVVESDVRDAEAVQRACRGMDSVCHLAAINGTEFFYSMPEAVLEVAVKGIVNVVDGALRAGVGEFVVASSSEVYHVPPRVPADERVPLVIPDPLNPRFSYAGGKIVSELMTLNFGRRHFQRAVVFRPHNVYGPDMGWEHVIPQLTLRIRALAREPVRTLRLTIQGTGRETRAFVFIEDAVEGIVRILERGAHLEIYNVGSDEETSIWALARQIGRCFDREVELVPSPAPPGSPPRRCPDIGKLKALGFAPRVPLAEGVSQTVRWYDAHAHEHVEVGGRSGSDC